jgi:hypothetical protein
MSGERGFFDSKMNQNCVHWVRNQDALSMDDEFVICHFQDWGAGADLIESQLRRPIDRRSGMRFARIGKKMIQQPAHSRAGIRWRSMTMAMA